MLYGWLLRLQDWFIYMLGGACLLMLISICLAAFVAGAVPKPEEPRDKDDED